MSIESVYHDTFSTAVDVQLCVSWPAIVVLRELPDVLNALPRSAKWIALNDLVPAPPFVVPADVDAHVNLRWTLKPQRGADILLQTRRAEQLHAIFSGELAATALDAKQATLKACGTYAIPWSPASCVTDHTALQSAAQGSVALFLDVLWQALLDHFETVSDEAYRRSREGANRSLSSVITNEGLRSKH